ncbi:aromatase/cyclase [Streptomyces sp. NY05-11A]|uniref:aromatase/cyclase n=1 Tax=Streptomyces soliscabiei TaxID=588897 RepID=UPI0029A0383D|nr:SRPBCC family protein [Streptomyces sp. NY05-11A]MDX2680440.1 SRPBCC family protein [Streptomyces sp. NY05-11A]
MAGERVHHRTYSVDVDASAGAVYALLADSTRWPLFLRSSIHVERLDFDGVHDRFQAWTQLHGTVRSCLVRRTLDAGARRIDFRQEVPAGPLLAHTGSWRVEARASGRCRLALDHDVTLDRGGSQDADAAVRATDARSAAELARLKAVAERWDRLEQLLLSFEESVRIKGPAELVYSFLCSIADWPGRVPHVLRAEVAEEQPGVQVVRTETRCGGLVRSAETVRVCFPHALRIIAKETAPQEPFQAHTTEWSVVPGERDVTVLAHHQVLLREDPDVATAAARAHARDLLGGQSRAVLNLAKRHAETAVRTL